MAGIGSAVLTTVILTGIVAALIVNADLEGIRQNWDTRRCELPVMMAAGFVKPKDVSMSGFDYTQSNFKFCMSHIADSALRTAFAPLYMILGKQVDAMNMIQIPLNSVRAMLARAKLIFESYLGKQAQKYNVIALAMRKTWQHLIFAMGRIQAIVFSIVYMGLSANALFQNTIDFVFYVIKVFIIIMISLIILLFFVLLPVMPAILGVIAVMASIGIGTAGLAGPFCVDPDALVRMADGSFQKLGTIRCGDTLFSQVPGQENIVEGVLEADAESTPLVKLYGVKMSGSHRVLCKGKWILAEEHPDAKALGDQRLPRLICLNTSRHEVPIATGNYTTLWVGDWEEVDTPEGRRAWIEMVDILLNKGCFATVPQPTAAPLVSPETKVWKEGGEAVPIHTIQIGDRILSKNQVATTVSAVYKGVVSMAEAPKSPEWCSDGVWKWISEKFWTCGKGIEACASGSEQVEGVFLVTEDETFLIELSGKPVLVRDFTEVGASRIHETYEMLDLCINKK
jgi:hypothetical protein